MRYIFMLCVFLGPVVSHSQALIQGKFYPGYIVEMDGDTLVGQVKLINLLGNQYRTYFMEKEGQQAKKYVPGDIMAYGVVGRHYEYQKWSGDGVDLARLGSVGELFLRKIMTGRIKVFQYYEDQTELISQEENGSTVLNLVIEEEKLASKWLVKKLDGKVYDMAGTKFIMYKSGMRKYLKDYPELASKIGKKGYKRINFLETVEEYNQYWIHRDVR